MILLVPVLTADTIPEELPTVATEALELLQVPPDGAEESVEVPDTQIDNMPMISSGRGLTVIALVLKQPDDNV